jgi:branched-chain amino acid transport system ATP-binding protein
MLEIEHLHAGYRPVRVLQDVSLSVAANEAVGVLGPNGAGKTTLLRAIAGICTIYSGRAVLAGEPLGEKPDHERAALGLAHVPEGRKIWPSLTVQENLMMGAWRLRRRENRHQLGRLRDHVLDHFPQLRERLQARAAVLSGGEQQMLAIGRALMSRPRLLLVDEPSLGLAPIMVEAVMIALRRLRQNEGLSIVLVEQRTQEVLDLCDRVYILSRGRIVDWADRREGLTREAIEGAYFEGS